MKLLRVFSLVTFIFLVLCSIIVMMEPNKFQKFNSIESTITYQNQRLSDISNKLNIETFLASIPYVKRPHYIYTVDPLNRFQQTIQGGNGDCSNFSFGGAYYFIDNDISFELIHFLPPDSLFSGGGHVAVQVHLRYGEFEGVGVIDLAGGGAPFVGGRVADVENLINPNDTLVFKRINNNAPEYYRNYYTKEYLNQVYLGFTPASDVNRYFNFIDLVYLNLGSPKIEKLLYDGLALLFGQYYHIYVDDGFLEPFESQILLFKSLLLVIRICLVMLVGLLLAEIFRFVYKRARA